MMLSDETNVIWQDKHCNELSLIQFASFHM